MFNSVHRKKLQNGTASSLICWTKIKERREQTVIPRSTSCEEKLCRKFSPTETRTFNFYESGETRYGLFTDTGVYKPGYRKPNTILSRYCIYTVLIVDAIGNSK